LDTIPIIDPDSVYKIIWDFFICIITFVFIVLIPVEVCVYEGIFFVYPSNIGFGFCLGLLSLDLILNLNTSQFVKGELVSQRSAILHNQIRLGFVQKALALMILLVH
jgi:hypothetical protein